MTFPCHRAGSGPPRLPPGCCSPGCSSSSDVPPTAVSTPEGRHHDEHRHRIGRHVSRCEYHADPAPDLDDPGAEPGADRPVRRAGRHAIWPKLWSAARPRPLSRPRHRRRRSRRRRRWRRFRNPASRRIAPTSRRPSRIRPRASRSRRPRSWSHAAAGGRAGAGGRTGAHLRGRKARHAHSGHREPAEPQPTRARAGRLCAGAIGAAAPQPTVVPACSRRPRRPSKAQLPATRLRRPPWRPRPTASASQGRTRHRRRCARCAAGPAMPAPTQPFTAASRSAMIYFRDGSSDLSRRIAGCCSRSRRCSAPGRRAADRRPCQRAHRQHGSAGAAGGQPATSRWQRADAVAPRAGGVRRAAERGPGRGGRRRAAALCGKHAGRRSRQPSGRSLSVADDPADDQPETTLRSLTHGCSKTRPGRDMPLRVGIAGLGTVGAGVVQAAARSNADILPQHCPPADRGGRGLGARPRQGPRRRSLRTATGATIRWRWPTIPKVDVVVELIGGADGVGEGAGREGASPSGKHVVTANKALLAQHGAALARSAERGRRRAGLRGGGRRRHPDHQDDARGPGGQPDRAGLRHPQRHLQLHPDHRCARPAASSPRCWPRRSSSATPRPIPASTSTASTPRTSSRS